jgi:hypothetical protein
MFRENEDDMAPENQPSAYFLELLSIATEAAALLEEKNACDDPERREQLWQAYMAAMTQWNEVHARFAQANTERLRQAQTALHRWK